MRIIAANNHYNGPPPIHDEIILRHFSDCVRCLLRSTSESERDDWHEGAALIVRPMLRLGHPMAELLSVCLACRITLRVVSTGNKHDEQLLYWLADDFPACRVDRHGTPRTTTVYDWLFDRPPPDVNATRPRRRYVEAWNDLLAAHTSLSPHQKAALWGPEVEPVTRWHGYSYREEV